MFSNHLYVMVTSGGSGILNNYLHKTDAWVWACDLKENETKEEITA